MFDSLSQNLSRNQKIGLSVALQMFLLIIVIYLFNMKPGEIKEEVRIDYGDNVLNLDGVPENEQVEIRKEIFNFLANRFPNKNINEVDITVRDESVETYLSGADKGVKFVIDIDELKQTYIVNYAWGSDEGKSFEPFSISCPRKSEMKYPETFCESAYNDTSSVELYLPYSFDDMDRKESFTINLKNEKIVASIVACDVEKQGEYRKQIDEYLGSTGIDFSKYSVKYDFECYSE